MRKITQTVLGAQLSWGETVRKYIPLWWSRGLLGWKLRPSYGFEPGALHNAIGALLVGIALSTIVEFFLSLIFFPKVTPIEIFGLPLYGIVLTTGAAVFTVLFCVSLKLVNSGIEMSVAASLTAYALSGLYPVLQLLMREQQIEAIRLFLQYRDPSLPYFRAATYRLLLPHHAALSATVRVWVFALLEIMLALFYSYKLCGALIEVCHKRYARLKVIVSLVAAFSVQACLVYWYFDRLYWIIIVSKLRGQA
jgi:hypothetical protein